LGGAWVPIFENRGSKPRGGGANGAASRLGGCRGVWGPARPAPGGRVAAQGALSGGCGGVVPSGGRRLVGGLGGPRGPRGPGGVAGARGHPPDQFGPQSGPGRSGCASGSGGTPVFRQKERRRACARGHAVTYPGVCSRWVGGSPHGNGSILGGGGGGLIPLGPGPAAGTCNKLDSCGAGAWPEKAEFCRTAPGRCSGLASPNPSLAPPTAPMAPAGPRGVVPIRRAQGGHGVPLESAIKLIFAFVVGLSRVRDSLRLRRASSSVRPFWDPAPSWNAPKMAGYTSQTVRFGPVETTPRSSPW